MKERERTLSFLNQKKKENAFVLFKMKRLFRYRRQPLRFYGRMWLF